MTQQSTRSPINPKDLRPGMVVQIHQNIKEKNAKGEEKERIQLFEGTVISRHAGSTNSATFTVRKISAGIGVEKIFPTHSPIIVKIDLVKQLKTKKAKLYFLKEYRKRMKVAKPRAHLHTISKSSKQA